MPLGPKKMVELPTRWMRTKMIKSWPVIDIRIFLPTELLSIRMFFSLCVFSRISWGSVCFSVAPDGGNTPLKGWTRGCRLEGWRCAPWAQSLHLSLLFLSVVIICERCGIGDVKWWFLARILNAVIPKCNCFLYTAYN